MPDKWPSYFEPVEWTQGESNHPDYFEPVNFQPRPRTPDTSRDFGSGYGLPSLRDIGLTALKIPIQLGETASGLGDIATWGNLSKILDPKIPKGWRDYISSFETPELKSARQEFGQAKGFSDSASSVYRNPGLAGLAIEESLPYLAGASGIAKGAMKVAPGLGRIGASMLGEAATGAGTQAAQIREDKGSFGPLDSLYAAGSGAITGLISGGSGKVAQRFGLPDIDAMLADNTVRGVRRIPALIGGGASEAVEEALQSGQEQSAVNLATGKPIGQGVAPSMTMGGVTGGVMGGTLPTLRSPGPQTTVLPKSSSGDAYKGGQRRLTTDVPRQGGTYPSTNVGGGPRFYAGEAGVAENRPYTIDMSSPLPGDMQSGSGTVSPTELGSLNQIPPDLAARRGVGFGEPAGPPTQTNQDLIADLMRRAAKGEDISAELAQLQERGVDLAQPVSPDQPSGALVPVNQGEDWGWGPTSESDYMGRLPDDVVNQPKTEVLPLETKLDIFGYPTDRDLTAEEVAEVKERLRKDLMSSYGEDVVEGQRAVDEVDGIIDTTATRPYDAGDQELFQATNEPEQTLRLRIPVDKPRTGHVTYQRVNGRNVKLIDGVPEDQAGERELVQEPVLQRTPENESLLRKFFRDESGTMDFDEMRRRFLAIRKGEPIGDVEKKGVAEFEPKGLRESIPTQDLQRYLASESVTPELKKQIENVLRTRGVTPEPDFTPVSKNLYEGWHWDDQPVETTKVISGATPEAADLLRSEIASIEERVANPELKPDGTRRYSDRVYEHDRMALIEAKAELKALEAHLATESRGKLRPIEGGIRTRIPDDDVSRMEAPKKDPLAFKNPLPRAELDKISGVGSVKATAERMIGLSKGNWEKAADNAHSNQMLHDYDTPKSQFWNAVRRDIEAIGRGGGQVSEMGKPMRGDFDVTAQSPMFDKDTPTRKVNDRDMARRALDLEQGIDDAYKAGDIRKVIDLSQQLEEIDKAYAGRRPGRSRFGGPTSDEEAIRYDKPGKAVGNRSGKKTVSPQVFNSIHGALVTNKAASLGIDPSKFDTVDALEDAVFNARLMAIHAQEIADIKSKIAYYEKTGNTKELELLSNQLEDVHNKNREALVKESVDELAKAYPDISEMRVPGKSGNIALGGADPPVLDALGTALYSKDRVATWAKEGFQNANDEKKISKNTEPIRIVFRENVKNPVTGAKSKSLIIKDGGRGMSTTDLYTYFSDVGKTGKANEADASGGFGFAKASPFLGGELMRVTSVNKENGNTYRHTFQGNPAEFKNQQVGVPLNTVQVANSTKTGFEVEVFYDENRSTSSAKKLIEQTVENSPDVKDVELLRDYYADGTGMSSTREFLDKGTVNSYSTSYHEKISGKPIPSKKATLVTPGAEIDIHYEMDNVDRTSGTKPILNNGTFAIADTFSASGYNNPLPGIPPRIVINVRATVKEGQPGYPFTLNREQLDGDVDAAIDEWISQNIAAPARAKQQNEIQGLYDALAPAPGNNFIVLDSGEKYEHQELMKFVQSPEIKAVADVMGSILDDLNNLFSHDTLGETEKFGFRVADLKSGGINISSKNSQPNGRKNFALMVNPGIFADPENTTPQEAAQAFVHAVAHEFNHNRVRNEGGDFTWALYRLFSKWSLKEQDSYAEAIVKSITGQDGRYTPEFQEILSEYIDARGRPETVEDVLSRRSESLGDSADQSGRISEMADSDKPDGKGIRGKSEPRKFGGFPREPKRVGKSSTREAGKAAGTGKNQQSPITPETQSIRYPATSIRRLKDALQAGKLLQPYKLRMQSLERSRRAGAISGVKDPGVKGYFQKLGMLRGPLTPEIPVETKLTQGDLDNLMAGITNSTLMPYSKLRAQTGIMKLFAGQIPTGSESRLLGKVFGEDLPQLIQLHAGLGFTHPDDIKKFFFGAINIPKSLMSSLDLSYTLRQAAPFMLTKEYWSSFADMWKSFPGKQGSEAFDGAMQSIYDDPVYDFFQEFDRPLFIGEFKAGSELARREEAFGSDIASKIPLMAGAGRMQTAFINKLRFDVAKRMLNDMYKSGYIDWAEGQEGAARDKSRQDVQRMLDFVNNFTGRGNLGAAARFGPLLNSAFFSPAFQMSRFHILASPVTYLNAPPVVRREAWKSMFAIGSMLGLGIALTKAMGGDVEDDPNSTDWGKGRFGNTRVDFSQGLQPILVAGSRIRSGKSVSPDKVDKNGRLIPGKSYDLGKTFTGPTIRSIIGNFLINKASPAGGLINVWSQGEQAFPPGGLGGIQFPGKQNGNMSKAAALNMVIPMVVNDMVDLYKEDPNISPRGMSFLIASVLGLPVQTFDEPKESNRLPPLPPMQAPQLPQLNAPQMRTPQQDFYNDVNRRQQYFEDINRR